MDRLMHSYEYSFITRLHPQYSYDRRAIQSLRCLQGWMLLDHCFLLIKAFQDCFVSVFELFSVHRYHLLLELGKELLAEIHVYMEKEHLHSMAFLDPYLCNSSTNSAILRFSSCDSLKVIFLDRLIICSLQSFH